QRGVRRPLRNHLANWTVVRHGPAEIEPSGVTKPDDILLDHGAIKSVLRTRVRERFPVSTGAQRFGDVIARGKSRQEHCRRRHGENKERCKQKAADDVVDRPAHLSGATASVSAAHRICGRNSAGMAFMTRAEEATKTRGAAKYTTGSCSAKIR